MFQTWPIVLDNNIPRNQLSDPVISPELDAGKKIQIMRKHVMTYFTRQTCISLPWSNGDVFLHSNQCYGVSNDTLVDQQ